MIERLTGSDALEHFERRSSTLSMGNGGSSSNNRPKVGKFPTIEIVGTNVIRNEFAFSTLVLALNGAYKS